MPVGTSDPKKKEKKTKEKIIYSLSCCTSTSTIDTIQQCKSEGEGNKEVLSMPRGDKFLQFPYWGLGGVDLHDRLSITCGTDMIGGRNTGTIYISETYV